LAVGSRSTAAQHTSASLANAMQSLYISEGRSGSTSSCSQCLNSEAGTCGLSTPSSVYEQRSSHILRPATASESPGNRKKMYPRPWSHRGLGHRQRGTVARSAPSALGTCDLVGKARHRVAHRMLMGGMQYPVDTSASDVRVCV